MINSGVRLTPTCSEVGECASLEVQRAIWLVMAANHEGMKPGENYGGQGLHDHRFIEGMPGMGLMPDGSEHQHQPQHHQH